MIRLLDLLVQSWLLLTLGLLGFLGLVIATQAVLRAARSTRARVGRAFEDRAPAPLVLRDAPR